MNKAILFNKEAREKVRKGVNIIADAVAVTLGAAGRNVLISRSEVVDYGVASLPVKVTKDGVTVARHVQITDQIENIGALMMREASEKTMYQAGDGTTTTIVLARAMVEEGFKLIDEGKSPMEIKRQLDIVVEWIVNRLKEISIPVNDDIETIKNIAIVSANNDKFIGGLVAEAFEKIGKDGIIRIEEAKSVNTEIKIIDGFELKTGYISPYFITDRAKGVSELLEPNILLYEKVVGNLKDLENVWKDSIETGRPLLIICEDSYGDALSTLIMNHMQRTVPPICVIRCPYFTDNKAEVMEDIAACTGATYLTDSSGIGLDRATGDHLGKAKKVIISRDSTIIIGGYKDEKYKPLLTDLQISKAGATDEEERAVIERRIARLSGGIGVIYVGGPTETEMKERVDRVDDAVRATKAANEEGYVAGGGTIFANITDKIATSANENQLGLQVLHAGLIAPLKQILLNAGEPNVGTVINQIMQEKNNVGYNAKTGVIENLLEAGIVDPVKVLRCSLQNASSVAGMILTSQCVICDTLN